MGRNAPFGRPPASDRLRTWWDARSKTSRQNAVLAVLVAALFVAIIMAAVARDKSTSTSRVIASRPQPTTTVALPTPSTVHVGDLGAGSMTAADLFGLNTTSTTPAPATTSASAPPATRPAPATTAPPAPATTVTNPDIIFTTVPPTTTTTQPPVSTTRRTTTTTAAPTTTSTMLAPISVPALFGP